MKLKVLKCPECRANIEIEEGRTSCFCSYCGCKIIIDDEKSETTINKNININKNITHTERYVNEAEVLEIKTRDKNWKRNVILSIAIPLAAILFFVGIFGVAKHNSNVEEERLQTIVDEVMVDIKNGDFDEAYIKAESIRYTSDWSSDIEKKWDETRETLIKKIEKAEKEAKGNNSVFEWFN